MVARVGVGRRPSDEGGGKTSGDGGFMRSACAPHGALRCGGGTELGGAARYCATAGRPCATSRSDDRTKLRTARAVPRCVYALRPRRPDGVPIRDVLAGQSWTSCGQASGGLADGRAGAAGEREVGGRAREDRWARPAGRTSRDDRSSSYSRRARAADRTQTMARGAARADFEYTVGCVCAG